jgi:predicted TPR repeat methyltransferase
MEKPGIIHIGPPGMPEPLKSSKEIKNQFDEWGEQRGHRSYERQAILLDYNPHEKISEIILPLIKNRQVKFLDIGCGTGLTGEAFNKENINLDGCDISQEMLAQARRKNIYENLFLLDLTKEAGQIQTEYDGIISCGVFGDFVQPSQLEKVITKLKPSGIIGISGKMIPYAKQIKEILEREKFKEIARFEDLGYLGEEGNIDYLYVIASRNWE